jgi:hypothetical protein
MRHYRKHGGGVLLALIMSACASPGGTSGPAHSQAPPSQPATAVPSEPSQPASPSAATGQRVTVTMLAEEADPLAVYGGADLVMDAVIGGAGVFDPCPINLQPAWFDYCEGAILMLSDPNPASQLPPILLVVTSEELPPSVFAVLHPDAADLRDDPMDDLVNVTAHYDDPAAQECHHTEWPANYGPEPPPEQVILNCRSMLVITEIAP